MIAAKFLTPSVRSTTQPSATVEEGDEINLREYLGVFLDNKLLIAFVVTSGLLCGAIYASLAKPIYEANLLIQVEDSDGAASSILGEASSLFDVKTPAAGEIEIIRSRMVIGRAVEETRHYIEAKPRYMPLVGSWLASRASGLSDPGSLDLRELGLGALSLDWFGLAGFVSGAEDIVVQVLEMTPGFQKKPLLLTISDNGGFTLEHPNLATPLNGALGSLVLDRKEEPNIQVLVSQINGKVGSQFLISRSSRLEAIESLQRRLQLTEKGRQSGVISATMQDGDAMRLTVILNEIGRQYVNQNVERKAAEAQKTLAFLGEQLPQYKREQEEAERAYNRYRNEKGTVAFDEEARLILAQSVELQTKVLDAKQARRELQSRFTTSHPTVQTLDAQIAASNREIDILSARVRKMPQIQQDAIRMEREVRVNTEMYQSLLNSSLQLSLVKEGKIGNVRLLDDAVTPEVPVRPRKALIVATSTSIGLLLGFALAVARNSYLRGIRSPNEIEALTGLNVYATIPLSTSQGALGKEVKSKRLGIHILAAQDPGDPAIESLRSLRTALQFAMLEAMNNRVLITGPTPGVGKTFISVNFAAIMAAAGKRVLLVDADMRKGHINQHLGLRREQGLSELIAGSLSVKEVVHVQVVPGLDVITTGVLPPNPAELMMSDSFAQILDELSKSYDLIILDTPPVLVAADTVAVSVHAGTVLLVSRADMTHIGELQESAKRLSHAGKAVNGVLFNAMDVTRGRYGNYGYEYSTYRYSGS